MNTISITNMRLVSQQLITADFKTPREIIAWLGAIQAQDFSMAKWGIGARLPGITDKEVEDAMNKGEFVRTHILRPTWHFVSRDDIHWMLQLSAPRLKGIYKTYDKYLDITPDFITKTNSLISKILDKEPHQTRQDIGAKLQEEGIECDNRRMTHIMSWAELEGIVCNGTVKGTKQTYDLLENRVPKPNIIFDKNESLYKLAYKYFRSHGPATLQDFVWWSGLTTTEAKKAIEFIKSDFIFETIGLQTYIFHELCARYIPNRDTIHFLPAFDETFVSYKDRTEILPLEHQKKVIVSNGVFHPTISKNGEIIGTWKKVSTKKEISINTKYIFEPDKSLHKLIDKASSDLYAFYK
ncbi:MAG: winged helix DNA-binding domain-containing protein [Dysgonomonas sp.]